MIGRPFQRQKEIKKVQVFTAFEKGSILGFAAANTIGSFLIQELCRTSAGKKVILRIKKLDTSAENSQQRIAHRRFFLKNNFTSSELCVRGVSGTMEMLNFDGAVFSAEYLDFQKYALGCLLFRHSQIRLVTV